MSPTRTTTDEELLQLPRDGNKYELVDGELVVSPGAGYRHEWIVGELVTRLRSFAKARELGEVLPSNLLYVLPSGNRRGPDVSFIARARAAELPSDTVFPRMAPDLAVEILSPSDSPRRVQDKIGEYLEAGVRLVWIIDAENRRAVTYRSLSSVEQIGRRRRARRRGRAAGVSLSVVRASRLSWRRRQRIPLRRRSEGRGSAR